MRWPGVGQGAAAMARTLRRMPPAPLAGLALLIAVILGASVMLVGRPGGPNYRRGAPPPAVPVDGRIKVALPPPDLLRPLTAEEAILINAKRAPDARPDTPAAKFNGKTADDISRMRALDCLNQAIYYEAASESVDGQRAVAQVVLNRVRHPAYPASVCGVVYQGSERTTGCQFSFTCDGSLRRIPAASLWQRARKLAGEALAGKVFGPVGHATYYHADYVVPYWADSLDKEIQIGRHIFYRLRGKLGTRRAFDQRYRGQELAPLTPTDIAVIEDALAPGNAATTPDDSALSTLTAPIAQAPKRTNPVLADLTHGELLADVDRSSLLPPLIAPRSPADDRLRPCPSTSSASPARIVANDNRLGRGPATDCR